MQPRLPDRYRVIEEVGQGGMAVVYRAQDETLRREVAVKVLHPHLLTEPESKARLEREAQAVAKLQHDNIVQIYDYSGGDSPESFIVTEFIDGRTLKQLLADHRPAFPEVASMILCELGAALVHAHGLGIIHRDLKPENVMVRKDGVLKLMDFGVAQVLDLERMTVTGQLLGSPAYMAPEILEGKPLDFRTDVFALGVMLYQLSTGQLPFTGRNPHEVFKRISEGRYPDPRGACPRVSQSLHRIIARALARNPDERYPGVDAMLTELRGYLADAGLAEPREELRQYFVDPAGYERALASRVVSALLVSGKKAQAEGRAARAIELWSRALVIAPEDPALKAQIAKLEGRRRLRIGGFAAAGLAVLAVVAVAGRGAWRRTSAVPPATRPGPAVVTERTPAPSPLPTATAPPTPEGIAPDPDAPPARPRAHPAATRPTTRALAPDPSQGATRALKTDKVRFSLGPIPTNVDVYLDQTLQFHYDPDHRFLEVPWDGDHVVEFRSACCFTRRFTVGPAQPRPENDHIVARLSGKPASLTVQLDPPNPDAKVLVTEEGGAERPKTAVAGQPVTIGFESTEELRKPVVVFVFVGKERVASETVEVTAGDKKTHKIALSR